MKTKTNIYVEVSTNIPKKMKRGYGYILEYKGNTVSGFGTIEGTYHQTSLHAVNEALGRYRTKAEITIHITDPFIANMAKDLEKMKMRNFANTSGKPIANAEEWKEFSEQIEKHEVSIESGKHEYASWIKSELDRRK